MIRVGINPEKGIPQAVAAKRIEVDSTRISRRPKMFAMGTQKMFPSPSTRTLNCLLVSMPQQPHGESTSWRRSTERGTYRHEGHQVPRRPAVLRELLVPQRQRRSNGCRDVVRHESVERHGDHAGHLPPPRPVQRVRGVRGGERELDDAVHISAVLVRHAVFWVGLACRNMIIGDDELALTNEHDSTRGSGRLDGFARERECISPAWHRDIRVSEARVGTVRKRKWKRRVRGAAQVILWTMNICGHSLGVYV